MHQVKQKEMKTVNINSFYYIFLKYSFLFVRIYVLRSLCGSNLPSSKLLSLTRLCITSFSFMIISRLMVKLNDQK